MTFARKAAALFRLIASGFAALARKTASAFRRIASARPFRAIGSAFRGYAALWRRFFGDVREKGFSSAVSRHAGGFIGGLKNNKFALRALAGIIAPMLIIATLLSSLSIFGDMALATGVDYDGELIAFVSEPDVATEASGIFVSRVEGGDGYAYIKPVTTRAVLVARKYLVESETLADRMIDKTDTVRRNSGFYVDGVLKLVSTGSDVFVSELREIIHSAVGDAENATANFLQNVEIKQGIYPVSLVKTRADVCRAFEEKAIDLTVKTTVIEKYNEEIAFETVETLTASETAGTTRVLTEGVNGLSEVTANVTYVNGEEISRSVVSSEVITEPVNCELLVGIGSTMVSSAALASGASMIWPLPSSSSIYVSAPYGDGRNHKGIDIAAPAGTSIFAARGGTVSVAGWYSGYGLAVMIDHGDGVQTLYGHCSYINVNVGDTVPAGLQIAGVGITGYATGYHLHFEVRINGTAVDPAPYLGI